MGVGVLLYLASIVCCVALGSCRIWEIPVPEAIQNCYNRVKSVNVDRFVGSQHSWLCENTLMNSTYNTEPLPQKTIEYVDELFNRALISDDSPNRFKRQAGNRCARKEYRMLTIEEKRRYHDAVRALKRDVSIRPNKYDALASIHTDGANFHGGPGFFGWHRIYLFMYETALRQIDPRVCLPYWDTTLESKLQDPLTSSIWTAEFLGTPRGSVVNGPFANWLMPNGGPLIRNVGIDGDLLTTDIINDVLSRTSYEEIVTSDTVDPRYHLELHHGAVHTYVGGAMSGLKTAAFDPIFFMYHAFIDYIFERIRTKLRSINVNPAAYPRTTIPMHQGNSPMGLSRTLTHADGYSENIANRVSYEPVPTCSLTSQSCGAGSLVCQISTGFCLPATTARSGLRTKREATSDDTCSKPPTYGLPNQNDFCVGSCCDTDEWVMIPVKIFSVRPPRFTNYKSYPVRNGKIDYTCDIYSPDEKTNKYIYSRQGNLRTYERCHEDAAIGQIFLYSHGINYPGYYKESTIVDQKFTVSISLGFIGVQKPSQVEGGVSKALLRAHDSCGRVCQVACRDADTKEYKVCSGAIAVDEKKPRMFRRNFDEAVLSVVGFSKDKDLPTFKEDNLYIAFYCDYQNEYPLANRKD